MAYCATAAFAALSGLDQLQLAREGVDTGLLRAAAESPNFHVRSFTLGNPNLPLDVVTAVVANGVPQALTAVLKRPNLPEDLVIRAVSLLVALPREEAFLTLRSTRALGLRAVMSRRDQTESVLLLGARSVIPMVAQAAASAPGATPQVMSAALKHGDVATRIQVALTASPEVLAGHNWAKERSMKVLLASAPRATGVALGVISRRLTRSANPEYRTMAARFSSTTEEVSALCVDVEAQVRATAAANPVATEDDKVLEALLR